MKTKILGLFVIILIYTTGQGNSFGQGFSNVGSAGATFLKIPVDPIGASLGNSNVASVQGVAGMLTNPASLAYITGTEVLLSNVNWIAETRLSSIGIAQKLGPGAIGVSVTALTMGQMEITTEDKPNGTGNYFNAGSYAIGLSYGMDIIDKFSFGGTVKYVYEYIWDTHGSTYLFDLGSVYRTYIYNLRIGMKLANFGGNVTFSGSPIDDKPNVIGQSGISYPYDPRLERVSAEYPLPQLFNVGISFDPMHTSENLVTITAAVNDANDNKTQLLFGGEYVYQNMLSFRIGYKSGFDEQNISAGLGFKTNLASILSQVDFAYLAFGKLGNVVAFSLKLGL